MAQSVETLVAERENQPAVRENVSPGTLTRPAFVMNLPFSFSTAEANNPWMEDMPTEKRRVDRKLATVQFLNVYRYLASEAVVYLLPTPRNCGLQDLVFTANLGVVLEHWPQRDVVIISNFTSEPRRGETAVGADFFEAMGYRVHVAPSKFEGDAELKHLHDNIYVGGYGTRSERETYDWMERTFGMQVIKVRLTDPYLYHLDCSVFPITRENTLVCTELFEEEEVAEIERHTNIIDVSVDVSYSGICNSLRLSNTLLNASHIHDLKAGTQEYTHELTKNRRIEDIAANLALEVTFFNLSEYLKGGALLSCMVMHLNRKSYEVSLL
jgi:N-dimethylarginine dimethylaminohydrolase